MIHSLVWEVRACLGPEPDWRPRAKSRSGLSNSRFALKFERGSTGA